MSFRLTGRVGLLLLVNLLNACSILFLAKFGYPNDLNEVSVAGTSLENHATGGLVMNTIRLTSAVARIAWERQGVVGT